MLQPKQFKHRLPLIFKPFLHPITPVVGLIIGLILFVLISSSALISTHHFLYNLEPYPDGLIYTLAARNFALGKGLQLNFNDQVLKSNVPTLYPLVLSLGYLFNSFPATFVWINIVLGLVTIIFVYKTVINLANSKWLSLLAASVYLSHAYIWLLPTLPMTENLALSLMAMSVFLLTQPRFTKINILFFLIVTTGLALTRFAAVPISLVLLMWGGGKWWQTAPVRIKKWGSAAIILGGILIWFGLNQMGFNLWTIFIDFLKSLFSPIPSRHFSFNYLPANVISYFKILLGLKEKFLWFNLPFSSLAVTLATAWVLIFSKIKPFTKWMLGSLILCQIPLLLILNGADARYLILTIPLFSICWGLFAQQLTIKFKSSWVLLIIGLLLLIQLLSQALLFKQIMIANVFHRTRAWQYEAILNFNIFFVNHPDATLITALPPFLADAYQSTPYQLLPLSNHQEFLAKKEYVWGQNINYENLEAEYKNRLTQGENIYISNAYITHQWEVVADFESIKSDFVFNKVADGCQQACEIYQLSLPIATSASQVKSKNSAN